MILTDLLIHDIPHLFNQNQKKLRPRRHSQNQKLSVIFIASLARQTRRLNVAAWRQHFSAMTLHST